MNAEKHTRNLKLRHREGTRVLSCSVTSDSRTVACQAPLFMGFSRQEILEWVSISFSRGFS